MQCCPFETPAVSWSPVKTPLVLCRQGAGTTDATSFIFSNKAATLTLWASQDRLECALRKWKMQNISQSSSVVYESTVVIVSPSCLTYWSAMLPSFAALALPTPELPVRKTEFCVVIMRSYQVQAFMEAKAVWTANLLRLSGSKNAKWTPRILIHFQLIAWPPTAHRLLQGCDTDMDFSAPWCRRSELCQDWAPRASENKASVNQWESKCWWFKVGRF